MVPYRSLYFPSWPPMKTVNWWLPRSSLSSDYFVPTDLESWLDLIIQNPSTLFTRSWDCCAPALPIRAKLILRLRKLWMHSSISLLPSLLLQFWVLISGRYVIRYRMLVTVISVTLSLTYSPLIVHRCFYQSTLLSWELLSSLDLLPLLTLKDCFWSLWGVRMTSVIRWI